MSASHCYCHTVLCLATGVPTTTWIPANAAQHHASDFADLLYYTEPPEADYSDSNCWVYNTAPANTCAASNFEQYKLLHCAMEGALRDVAYDIYVGLYMLVTELPVYLWEITSTTAADYLAPVIAIAEQAYDEAIQESEDGVTLEPVDLLSFMLKFGRECSVQLLLVMQHQAVPYVLSQLQSYWIWLDALIMTGPLYCSVSDTCHCCITMPMLHDRQHIELSLITLHP